ncbi:hypothetical protein J6590_007826 [Homalodisca vitripennis]|nr:hypothetical protein J6590_007826 [Homalodisca vitripennis]
MLAEALDRRLSLRDRLPGRRRRATAAMSHPTVDILSSISILFVVRCFPPCLTRCPVASR